jgi:hypothetical protein
VNAVEMIVACAIGQGCNKVPWREGQFAEETSDAEFPRAVVRDLTGEPSNPWRTV